MKDINFLPDHYRQRNELRRARWWWGICAGIFGGVVAITMCTQWTLRRGVYQQLALVEPLYQAARNHDQQFVSLQKDVTQQGETAALYIYLQHPWRRSQILAAVVQHLPTEVTLAAIDLKLENRPQTTVEATSSTRKRGTQETATQDKGKTPEQRDLAKLRSEYDVQNTVVELRGTTVDDAQLHAYVAKLTEHPLLSSVRLQSLEALAGDTKQTKSRFVVRMQLKPGYGQPNGPEIGEVLPKKPPAKSASEQAQREVQGARR